MPSIALLGRGPLPGRAHRHHAAAGLRTWQFARAIASTGADLDLLLVDPDAAPGTTVVDDLRITTLTRDEVDEPRALRALLDRLAPDALVGATSYASFLLARTLHPAPLWVDFHGDPAAEGQALARATDDDRALANFLWMLHWCLRRGDRFSSVSERQRLVALGQLGAVGRLNRWNDGLELVAPLPDAVAEIPDEVPPTAANRFQVVFTGSFNSWIDGDTLLAAAIDALGAHPSLCFAFTGGAIGGFLEEPWRRFEERLAALSPALRSRIAVHGWVEATELDRIEAASSCGVVPEERLLEREFGSQNRSLRWMARGLPVVTTAQCELGAAIERERLGLVYRPGDPADLSRALVELASDRETARELGRRARAWVARHRTIEATTGALRAWVRAPALAPDRFPGRLAASDDESFARLAEHPRLEWIRGTAATPDR